MYKSWRSAWCTKAELSDRADSETTKEAPPCRVCITSACHRRGQEKNDRIDANKIADRLRCDFLPECYMASTEIRERRRTLRYCNLLVHQAVHLKKPRRGAEAGGLFSCHRSQPARFSGSREGKLRGGLNCRREEQKSVFDTRPARSCCCRLGDGAQAPDTTVELFQDWQEITNSIFCGGRWWPRQQMDVSFCISQERSPRGTTASRRT